MNEPTNQSKVLIAVLCGPERYQWIAPDLMMRLIEAQHLKGVSVAVSTVYGIYGYDTARNHAVERFLQSDAEWLCMIDNDNVPPAAFLQHVMEFVNWHPDHRGLSTDEFIRQFTEHANRPSLDIVALPYYVRPVDPGFPDLPRLGVGWNAAPNAAVFIQVPCLAQGWQEVHAASAGCIFISRRVLTTLGSPWFQLWEENAKTIGGGEDVDFCLRARKAGFHIWTNAELLVDHFHTVSLNALARLARHGLGAVDRRDDGE